MAPKFLGTVLSPIYDGFRVSPLSTEDVNHLRSLQRSNLRWEARTDPQALAPLAIEARPAHRVADLRDGVRFLRAWLMTLDDALNDARLLQPNWLVALEEAAKDGTDTHD